MVVELRPLGVACNIQCLYCYQTPQRDAKNYTSQYDLEMMKAAVEKEGGPFSLFGGEALLVPIEDLEKLWSWGYEKYGSNGIQTNGVAITDEHIRLFKTYAVHVGLSIDGPGELNDARWAGTLQRTRDATAKTEAAIERLRAEQVPFSLIVTLHRGNASAEKLPIMHDWFRYLESIGLSSVRLHTLEVENEAIRHKYQLTPDETITAFLSFYELEKELTYLKFDLFADMHHMLQGKDNKTTCIWNACDPYTTAAVRGIEGHGQRSNCGRTNKDGIDFVKSSMGSFERYISLYHTPQEYGGCNGCRFFLMCKGTCPGTAIDGDWRNRTENCNLYKTLFRHFEEEMLDGGEMPVSVRPDRQKIEQVFLDAWAQGQNTYMANILNRINNNQPFHIEFNSPHGDTPHGDSHGDHTDAG